MRFSLKQGDSPLAWPVTDVDLATVVVIDTHRPIGPQALSAAIVRRPGAEIRGLTLLAAAATAVAFGLAALSYLA